jgi:hypothetical protein
LAAPDRERQEGVNSPQLAAPRELERFPAEGIDVEVPSISVGGEAPGVSEGVDDVGRLERAVSPPYRYLMHDASVDQSGDCLVGLDEAASDQIGCAVHANDRRSRQGAEQQVADLNRRVHFDNGRGV